MLKRIAIIGSESTGKTTLARTLSGHYNTNMVGEYAREYFNDKEYNYNLDDIVTIAKKQMQNENEQANKSKRLLFCDTDFLGLKIWSSIVFGCVPEWIENHVKNHVYDLYLLCNNDVDWVKDKLRNNKHSRQYIFNLFVKELDFYGFNYKIVENIQTKRVENAIKFVDEIIEL